jgi:hypothetical protein
MLQIDHRQCFWGCETIAFGLPQHLSRTSKLGGGGATPHPTHFGLIVTIIPPMLQLGDKGRGRVKKNLAGAASSITI